MNTLTLNNLALFCLILTSSIFLAKLLKKAFNFQYTQKIGTWISKVKNEDKIIVVTDKVEGLVFTAESYQPFKVIFFRGTEFLSEVYPAEEKLLNQGFGKGSLPYYVLDKMKLPGRYMVITADKKCEARIKIENEENYDEFVKFLVYRIGNNVSISLIIDVVMLAMVLTSALWIILVGILFS